MPRRKKTELRQSLEFAAILALLGLVFGAISWWRGHIGRAQIFAGTGVGLLAFALIAQPVWIRLFRLWMKMAEGMGWVMTRVILTLFYFLFLTPFGIVMKLLGKETLDTAWHDGKSTYWVDKEPVEPSLARYAKRY